MKATYKLLEAFSLSKNGDPATNEDGFFISENYVAVIDGATSKSSTKDGEKSGGQLAKDIIIATISTMTGDEKYDDAISMIQNALVMNAPHEKFGKIAASAAIFSLKNMEIWSVGDCQIVIDGIDRTEKKLIDHLLSEIRSFVLTAKINQGITVEELQKHDIGREMILPFLKMQSEFENTSGKFGYCVFNNTTDAKTVCSMGKKFSITNPSHIILASDGYPSIKNTLEESEQYLHNILKSDPLCFKNYVSTKGVSSTQQSFDDRTYLSFRIE